MLWLLFLIVTAYQNQGYWHPDEHFQILEFANFKAGLTPESMLPWEFAAKIRPWTLPAATLVVLQTLRGLHIYSPVTQTFVLRLLTVLGALASSLYFLRALRLSDYISERQESYTCSPCCGLCPSSGSATPASRGPLSVFMREWLCN